MRVARGPGEAELDVAVGDGGRVAVAWARERRVAARVLSGGQLGGVDTVGDAGTDTTISAAVAPSGAVLVSRAAEELGADPRDDGDDYGPYAIRAVLAAPNGRFERAAAVRAPGEPSSRLRNRSPARSAPRGSTSRSTPRVGGCS